MSSKERNKEKKEEQRGRDYASEGEQRDWPEGTWPEAMLRGYDKRKAELEAEKQVMKLYYIRADSESGDNLDLFVRASSPEDAEMMWKAYFSEDADSPIASIREVPSVEGPPGAISWRDV